MKNWESTEILRKSELKESFWYQGFFQLNFDEKDLHRRNFEELRYRDLSLFSMGQIGSKRILDIGCGTGLYTLTFLKLGAEFVAGQDISKEAVESASNICKRNGFSNFDIKAGNCETLLFADNTFDLVFAGDIFEHVTTEQKVNFINEIFRVLKPGGSLTIKTPNKSYLQVSTLIRQFIAIRNFKNPFNIHIPHTKNNPDNEHHGLTTYIKLKKLFNATMFHEPVITYTSLYKSHIPRFIKTIFRKSPFFNPQIILTVRKPIFYGLYS